MINLLSTKILNSFNTEKIISSGIEISSYNAISIEKIDFNIDNTISNAIFTSKNAVEAVLNKKILIKNCYCVGEKNKITAFKKWPKSS